MDVVSSVYPVLLGARRVLGARHRRAPTMALTAAPGSWIGHGGAAGLGTAALLDWARRRRWIGHGGAAGLGTAA
ncbi:MAG: hypothetical protein RMJ54_17530, partial [Roseiflexaceae bacterium]|nr:hypothetical protein [Roseiflexaceae bacterium]